MILCRSDATSVLNDEKRLFDCIHMKFILVTDLAISCKMTVQELLRYANQNVYSNITYFLMLHNCVVWLIENSLCGFTFYKENILHKSWFYLLTNEKE